MTVRRVNNNITIAAVTKKLDPSGRKGRPLGPSRSKFTMTKASPQHSLKEAKTQPMGRTETPKTLIPVQEEEVVKALTRPLIEHQWYHGVMPREEINESLKANGDFLIRKTTEKNRPIICLSVRHKDEARHFPLTYENGNWFIKNMDRSKKFFDLVELLDFLVTNKFPLPPSNAVLIRAIPRPEYYILHDDIVLVGKLGEGAFGEVWKGILKKRGGTQMDVAVKRMKANPTKSVIREFVREAKLMRQLQHQNIVTVHGVAPSEEPLMIIIELASNGCLKNNLKKTGKCPQDQLLRFCTDAARGMSYLSSQMIIHRDLAARNLLLGPHMEVKIADFGLSEAGKAEIKINRMKLPIRWLAPETIDNGKFTTKTDVWSFAVTMWEIFSFCATEPFPTLTNPQAKDLIRTRSPPMQAPPDTPSVIVRLMLDCFEKLPENRPTFPIILKKLSPKEDIAQYIKQTRLDDRGNELTASTCSNGSVSEKAVSSNTSDTNVKRPSETNLGGDEAASCRAVRVMIPVTAPAATNTARIIQDSKRASKTKNVQKMK